MRLDNVLSVFGLVLLIKKHLCEMERFNLIDWFKTNLEERMLEGNFCEGSLLCGLDLERMGSDIKTVY